MRKMFIAEVRDLRDPWESGRVRIRMYGAHDDEQNIKDEHLLWAMPLQNITSAATQKIGTAPVGMIVGSRVVGFFADEEEQVPIIIGSFARAGKLKDDKDNTKGQDNVDNKYNDVPTHSLNPDHVPRNPYHRIYKDKDNNKDKDKERYDPSPNAQKYNNAKYKSVDDGDELTSKARETYSDTKELKTLAKYSKKDADNKSILELVKGLDEKNMSGKFSKAPDSVMKILNISNMTSGAGLNNLTGSGLGQVFQMMGNQNGLGSIMGMLQGAMGGGQGGGGQGGGQQGNQNVGNQAAGLLNQLSGIDLTNETINSMTIDEREQLYIGMLHLLNNVDENGNVSPVNLIFYKNKMPEPGTYPVVAITPEGYFQVFSFTEIDPYPGYILWESGDGDYVFTVRPVHVPYAATPTDDVINAAIMVLYDALMLMAKEGKIDIKLLLALLGQAKTEATNQGMNNAMGQGSGQGGNQGGMMKILGQLGQLLSKAKDTHLPNSVLDQSKMQKTIETMQKQMTIAKRKKDIAKEATAQPNPKPTNNNVVTKNDSGMWGAK